MRRTKTLAILALSLFLAPLSHAQSVPTLPDLHGFPQHIAACISCHGVHGQGGGKNSPYIPRLAGLSASYLYRELRDFRDGRRDFPVMNYMTAGLSDAYLAKIADYFAAQQAAYAAPLAGTASAADISRGAALVEHGSATLGLKSCSSCHGADLAGSTKHHDAPAIAGQNAVYLQWQLQQWQTGARRDDGGHMAHVSDKLSRPDTWSVAAYLASLRPGHPVSAKTPMASATTLVREMPLYPLPAAASAQVRRGRYLAIAGDCAGCHTSQRSKPFAGAVAIDTPFGTIYTPNITPSKTSGIGAWTYAQFRRAFHDGVAPGHRYLYPAFPFPSYSNVHEADVKAIWSYLRALKPIAQKDRANTLAFPYSVRPMLFFWRTLFFHPHAYVPSKSHTAEWNRGAYLVKGLGHCEACHSPRGPLGEVISSEALAGGSVGGWHVPDITGDAKFGLGSWSVNDVAQFLRTGVSAHITTAMGPMRDVIHDSLQRMRYGDLRAIAVYLKSLNKAPAEGPALQASSLNMSTSTSEGRATYRTHCAVCHQDRGQGVPGKFPPLAADPMVVNPDPRDVIQMVLQGGFEAPTQALHREPYSMPPFGTWLSNQQVAAVVNYVRNAWGNSASTVNAKEVGALR